LATTTPTAVIRYTLDGSLPTAASALYTAPIELSGTTTLRAVASRDGWRDSPVLRAVYTLRVPTPVLSPAAGARGHRQRRRCPGRAALHRRRHRPDRRQPAAAR
jgi:chitinase